MPKKDRRKGTKTRSPVMVEDDDMESVASDITESTGGHSDEENGVIESEVYENKIREAMDLAAEKSVHTRINALISLKTALQKRVMTIFLLENYQTMCDTVERSLKKGRGQEQLAAAKLSSVLVLSLMGTDEAEEAYKLLHPALSSLVQNSTANVEARKEAALAFALVSFLACPEQADLSATLNILHNLFCCALPKGDGVLPTCSSGVLALHAAALQGVCLLLTLLSPTTVYTMAQKLLEEMSPVLASTDLDLRITVGEALALVHEKARCHDEDFRWKKQSHLVDKLSEFVTESHKFQAKKDRKVQKASFREIVLTIEEGEPFSQTVIVGPSFHRQDLLLSTWALRFQYQSLCRSLEQGLNYHMTHSPGLRNLFDLGPLPDRQLGLKSREKRPNRQTPEVKARLLSRGKNRDNRAQDLTYDD